MNYSKLKYRAIIIVDTENVSSNVLDSVVSLTDEDLLILPESNTSFKLTLSQTKKLLDSKCEIQMVHANNGTPNAMDFVLVSEISYLMGFIQADTYAIVSNDKGYTPVISLWQSRGLDIRLVGGIKSLHLNATKTMDSLTDNTDLDETYSDGLNDTDEVNTEMASKLAECLTCKISEEDEYNADNAENKVESDEEAERLKAEQARLVEETNQAIKDTKQHSMSKLSAEVSNMTESELEDLDHAGLSDRDYNKYILEKYIYKFGAVKADEIACLILDNKEFEDIEILLASIVKRKKDTVLADIEENWIRFRHNE